MNDKGVDSETLGSYLRKVREQAKVSARKLADLIGVNHSYITLVEQDKRKPSAEVLQAIADALPEVDLSKLLEYVGVRPTALLRSYFRRTYGEDTDEAEVVARLREYQEKTRKEENHEATDQKGGQRPD